MALRFLLSGLIGGVLAFLWGFLSWGITDMWSFGFKPLPNEAPLLAALGPAGISESNAYHFPAMPADRHDEAQMSAWKERHRTKAIGMVLVTPGGAEPMPPIVLVRGFAIEFVAALLLTFLVASAGGASLVGRGAVLFVLVAFVILATHGVTWNFLFWPNQWGRVMVADTAITWMLAGLPAVVLMRRAPKPV